jgi:hypothetical protein
MSRTRSFHCKASADDVIDEFICCCFSTPISGLTLDGIEQVAPLTTLFVKLKNAGKNVDPDVARQIYSQIGFRIRGHVTKQELMDHQ